MNIIKTAVLLHKFGLLDAEQSQAMEQARQRDVVIRDQFRLLDPDATDPSPAMIQLARKIAEEAVDNGPQHLSFDNSPIPPVGTVKQRPDGQLEYYSVFALAGGGDCRTETPDKVPGVQEDVDSRLVTVLLTPDMVAEKLLEVKIAQRMDDGSSEELISRKIPLTEANRPDGTPYLFAELDIPQLLGERANEIIPGTRLVYTFNPKCRR